MQFRSTGSTFPGVAARQCTRPFMAEPFPALAELIRLLSHEDAEIQIVRVNYNALTGSLEMRIAVFHDGPRATLDVTVVNFQFYTRPDIPRHT